MWKDSETELDFLDFNYLIQILKDTVNDEKLLPSSVGLYGDWGSGKSSLMYMSKKELEDQKDGTVCLIFNGWLYEGYDDAKTAMLGAILDGIKSEGKMVGKAKLVLGTLYESVDKFKLVKNGLKFGLDMILTGGVGSITDIAIRGVAEKVAKKATDIDYEDIVSDIKNALDYKELREDIREFREKFAELLVEVKIKKLVIFVDELDRCSPGTILETLEAMRLFLFNGNVSFVIGADERHIAYAIKTKFKDIEGINMDIGKEYQEKLIQYPIRIPSLNDSETEFYILCLLAQEHLNDNDFNKLVLKLGEKKKKDFLNFDLSYSVVKEIDETIADTLKDDLLTAKQLSSILSKGLNGNPRQCKRFLNSVDMRKKMAQYRGVTLNIKVLAKIMETEYFRTSLFRKMASLLNEGKLVNELQCFENKNYDELKELALWKDDIWVREWMLIEPALSGERLEEYFYFMRTTLDNKLAASVRKMSEKAQKIYSGIIKYSDMALKAALQQIEELSEFDRIQILDGLYNEMIQDEELDSNKTNFFLKWGKSTKDMQISTIEYLDGISGVKITRPLIPLIEAFYADCDDKSKILNIFEKWKKDKPDLVKKLDEIAKEK